MYLGALELSFDSLKKVVLSEYTLDEKNTRPSMILVVFSQGNQNNIMIMRRQLKLRNIYVGNHLFTLLKVEDLFELLI